MDEIEIVAYDPSWPARFDAEAAQLRATLDGDQIVGLEHFGSTAIAGLAAKPIIDILIAVRSLTTARGSFVEPLRRLGYLFWAENPKTDRLFFVKGMPPYGERRTHHVHVTEPDGELWIRLAFRDYLRAHPDEAARYERLKRDLAARFRSDREAYTEAKSAYVDEIMAKAAPVGRSLPPPRSPTDDTSS
ncbi:MAG TPA: GrpB family protein [Vineibacter sp.]|nr:GrpB family protein [Vineibacter sp.]